MSIFGQNAVGSFGSTSGSRHSLEIKAGRMNLVDSEKDGVKKKMVHPDNRSDAMICINESQIVICFCSSRSRKGLLYIYSADDG